MALSGGARKKIATAWIEVKPSMQGFYSTMAQQSQQAVNNSNNIINRGLNKAGRSGGISFGKAFKSSSNIGNPFTSITGLARRAGQTAGRALANSMNTAINAGKIGAGIAVGGAAVAGGMVAKGGLNRALNIEDATAKLKALKFEEKEIAEVTKNAMDSVKNTTFSFDSAMTTSVTGLAAGIKSGEQLTGYLKLIADTSTVAGASMDDIGYIFNKVQSNTKAYKGELNMLADRGIPIYAWLAKELKVSQLELGKMMKSGEVSSADFLNAVQKNIGGAATTSAATTRGYMSNFKSSLDRLGEAVMKGSLPVFTEVLKTLIPLVDAFTNASKVGSDNFWVSIGKKVLPPLREWVNLTVANVEAGKSMFPWFDKIKESIGSVKTLIQRMKNVITTIKGWGTALKESAFGTFMIEWGGNAKDFATHLKPIGEIFTDFILPAVQPFFDLFRDMVPMFLGLLEGVLAIAIPLKEVLVDIISTLINGLTGSDTGGGFAALGQWFSDLGASIGSFITEYAPMVIDLVKQLGAGIGEMLKDAFPKIVEVIKKLLGYLVDAMPSIVQLLPIVLDQVAEVVNALIELADYLVEIVGTLLPGLIASLGPIVFIIVDTIKFLVLGIVASVEIIKFLFDAIYNGSAIIANVIIGVLNTLIATWKGLVSIWNAMFGTKFETKAFLEFAELKDFSFDTEIFMDPKMNPMLPQMAKGGTILPRVGGTPVVVGEAGRAESIVDTGLLNKQLAQSNSLLRKGKQDESIVYNNSITVNTTGNVDENKLSTLIEKKLRRQQTRGVY